MKTLQIIIFLLFSAKVLATTNDYRVKQYIVQRSNPSLNAIKISMDFNKSEVLTEIPAFINKVVIERIDLVYSTYKSSENFDQQNLNKQRIKVLQRYCKPCNNDYITWESYGQTVAQNPELAKKLFHGFVIYFRAIPSSRSIKKEIDFMDSFVSGELKIPEPPIVKNVTTTVLKKDINKFVDSLIKYGVTDYSYRGAEPGKYTVTYKVIVGKRYKSYTHNVNAWLNNPGYDIVKKVFDRQPNWKKSVVLMDVTGSMSPYLAKTMAWMKATQKSDQVNAFVYFNDGDNKPDNSKISGNVKGIYHTRNINFETVYQTLKETMLKGNGGDIQENNIEALIHAQKHFPNQKEFVMVVDNWATPRDLALLHLVKKPVHVIVCGAKNEVNMAYINLAYKTKGSIHTIEQDLDMRTIEVGKKYQIGDTFISLKSGKFIEV